MEPKASNKGSSSNEKHCEGEKAMNVELIGRTGGGGNGSDSKGNMLKEKLPPQFLMKTYEMVEDLETNHLISWSVTGKSLVIWDQYQFAKELLPKHFKHNNFSSFIYQLNSYGFKKISSLHYEYENPFFQADSKHLLCSIKKRSNQPKDNNTDAPRKRARKSSNSQDFGAYGSDEAEIEKLKRSLTAMEIATRDLKRRQEATEQQLAAIEKRVEVSGVGKKQEVFTFMNNAIADPLFVNNFLERAVKKRRLATQDSAGGSLKHLDLNMKSGAELTTNESEIKNDSNLKCEEEEDCYYISMAKKMLEEEDLVWESGAEDHQSRIAMESKDLIAEPASGRVGFDWDEYLMELMQESGLPLEPTPIRILRESTECGEESKAGWME